MFSDLFSNSFLDTHILQIFAILWNILYKGKINRNFYSFHTYPVERSIYSLHAYVKKHIIIYTFSYPLVRSNSNSRALYITKRHDIPLKYSSIKRRDLLNVQSFLSKYVSAIILSLISRFSTSWIDGRKIDRARSYLEAESDNRRGGGGGWTCTSKGKTRGSRRASRGRIVSLIVARDDTVYRCALTRRRREAWPRDKQQEAPSLPPLSLPFLLLAGNYERPIKAGGRGTAGAEWNGRLSGRRRLFIERVELSQCGSRTPPHKRLSNRSTVSCLQTPANRIYTARSSLHSLELGRRNWGRIELGGAKKKTPRAGKIGSEGL